MESQLSDEVVHDRGHLNRRRRRCRRRRADGADVVAWSDVQPDRVRCVRRLVAVVARAAHADVAVVAVVAAAVDPAREAGRRLGRVVSVRSVRGQHGAVVAELVVDVELRVLDEVAQMSPSATVQRRPAALATTRSSK
jgi:hypothetical protein